MPIVNINIISMATQKNVLSNQILKKSLVKKIDKFLKILKETSKKRRFIYIFKQKTNIAESNYKTVVNNTLDNFNKESLSLLIPNTIISIFGTKKRDITIINADTY